MLFDMQVRLRAARARNPEGLELHGHRSDQFQLFRTSRIMPTSNANSATDRAMAMRVAFTA